MFSRLSLNFGPELSPAGTNDDPDSRMVEEIYRKDCGLVKRTQIKMDLSKT